MLFESVVAKPEDLLVSIRYYFFDGQKNIRIAANMSNNIWSSYDSKKDGRCFTAEPSQEIKKHGIEHIELYIMEKPVKVYFHTPGMFMNSPGKVSIEVGLNKKIKADLEHENFKMLDIDGLKCNNDINYRRDTCVHEDFEERAIKKYGCTTPFGPNKDKICRSSTIGLKVLEMYTETLKNHICRSPCSFISSRVMLRTSENYVTFGTTKHKSRVHVYFRENIKVIQAHYLYSGLSLIAEIGGYVGLFLGVSVNQITVLIDKIFNIL